MTDWADYARRDDLQAVIDPADRRGAKNRYIDLIHHKVLLGAFGNRLRGKSILDLGCGIGRFNLLIKESGGQVIGVDSCPGMLNKNAAKTVCAPITDLPFPDASFDFCLSVWTLQYLDEHQLSISAAEIARVLKPNGAIFIIEQLSASGYGQVYGRSTSTYWEAFVGQGFSLMSRRALIYAFDPIISIIRLGLIPEVLFNTIADFHLKLTRPPRVNKGGYVDFFQEFKKVR